MSAIINLVLGFDAIMVGLTNLHSGSPKFGMVDLGLGALLIGIAVYIAIADLRRRRSRRKRISPAALQPRGGNGES